MSLRVFPCICPYAHKKTGERRWVAEIRKHSIENKAGGNANPTLHDRPEDAVAELVEMVPAFAKENPTAEISVNGQLFHALRAEDAAAAVKAAPPDAVNLVAM